MSIPRKFDIHNYIFVFPIYNTDKVFTLSEIIERTIYDEEEFRGFDQIPLIFYRGALYEEMPDVIDPHQKLFYVYCLKTINKNKLVKKFNRSIILPVKSDRDIYKIFTLNKLITDGILNENQDSTIENENSEKIARIDPIQIKGTENEFQVKVEQQKKQDEYQQEHEELVVESYKPFVEVCKYISKIDKENRIFRLIFSSQTNKLYLLNEIEYKTPSSHHIKSNLFSVYLHPDINCEILKDAFNKQQLICGKDKNSILINIILTIHNLKLFIIPEDSEINKIETIDISDKIEQIKPTVKRINSTTKKRIEDYVRIYTSPNDYPIQKPLGFNFNYIFIPRNGVIREITNINSCLNKDKKKLAGGLAVVLYTDDIDMEIFVNEFNKTDSQSIAAAYYNIYKNRIIEKSLKKDIPDYENIIKMFDNNYELDKPKAEVFDMFPEDEQFDEEFVKNMLDAIFYRISKVEIVTDNVLRTYTITCKENLYALLNNTHDYNNIISNSDKIVISSRNGKFEFRRSSRLLNKIFNKIKDYYNHQANIDAQEK